MSARDTLIEWGLSPREADEVLWDHAHELAEQLVGEAAVKAPVEVYRPGMMWAAEVIDPQVEVSDG